MNEVANKIAPLIVEIRDVYGKPMIYPANEAAEVLASIAGTKTIALRAIQAARRLGLQVTEVYGRPLPEGGAA